MKCHQAFLAFSSDNYSNSNLLQVNGKDFLCPILARFMRIFPENICSQYTGRIINFHHSFLPFFEGANLYEPAFYAGVKMIGAACHYVIAGLDKGPLIEQDLIRINHTHLS